MGALCYRGPAAPPLRISRTVFDCAEGRHALLIPVLKTQFPVRYGSSKDKAKSTAFLVAQIFLSRKIPLRCLPCGASCRKISNGRYRARLRYEEGEMKDREQWMELCRQASVEQDSKKLLELTAEIIRLLDEKEDRLIHRAAKPEGDLTSQP